MESIEPFDFSSAVDFQTAYLSGYLADRYDVNADDSVGRANERVKKSTESVFAATVAGYHTVVPESSSVRLTNGRVRYALYPVWLLNTVWNGKRSRSHERPDRQIRRRPSRGQGEKVALVRSGQRHRGCGGLWPCVPVAAAALRRARI